MQREAVTWVKGAADRVYIAEPDDESAAIVYFMIDPPGKPVDIVDDRSQATRAVRVTMDDHPSSSVWPPHEVRKMLDLAGPQKASRGGLFRRLLGG